MINSTINSRYYPDGESFRIISGTINYFRVVPEYWKDRLSKLKACGMNAVETYTCWNLHERKRGSFNFEGMLNLGKFLQTAQELGLFVILRPGPYVCGEWDKGGLPSWLEMIPGMKLRCNNKPFLDAVRNYYTRLFDEIAPYLIDNGGNIICMQVENEYGSYGDDHEYMRAIKQIMTENIERVTTGKAENKVWFFTSDGPGYFMLNGGSLPDTLETINFGSNPKDNFRLLKQYRPDSPMMCTEYWNGWFDHWYEEHHTRQSGDTADVMREMLEMGASVNMYMFHGGTNFGYNNGSNWDNGLQPTVTSYDYNCPVSECGDLTDKYHEVKKVVSKYAETDTIPVANLTKKAYGKIRVNGYAKLFEHIDELKTIPTVHDSHVLSFEEIGADFGFMLYSSKIHGPFETLDMTIDGLNDRAHVYVREFTDKEGKDMTIAGKYTGKCLGIKENTGKRDDRIVYGLDFKEEAELNILVENLGRVNYGGHIKDHKGITGGVRFANCYHFGWDMTWLEMNDVSKVTFEDYDSTSLEGDFSPCLFRAGFEADEVCDTFLKLPGFHKGVAYVNGFNLGRYWNDAGPQKTLYIPAPLLKKGANEIVVFELDGVEDKAELSILLNDREELG